MKICEIATIVCPPNITGKWVRPVAKTLIQEPRHVPREPRSTESRRPYGIKYPLGKDRFLTMPSYADTKFKKSVVKCCCCGSCYGMNEWIRAFSLWYIKCGKKTSIFDTELAKIKHMVELSYIFLVILIILLYQINSFCIFNTFENEVVLDSILSVKTRVNFKSINTLDRNIHKNVRFVPCQLFVRILYVFCIWKTNFCHG